MAAELRLGVSFDLVYFRQQLQKLNQIAASEFSAKVKIGINKRDFQRQFNALSKDLKINVNDSQLAAARDRLTNLNKGLATFRRASAQPIVIKFKYEQQGQAPAGLSTGGGTFKQRLTSLGQRDKAALQQLYKAAGEASLLAFDAGIENNKTRMVKALGDVGEDSIQGLLNGLKSKDSDLKSAAKGLGNDLIRSIKDVLGIASPSREFKKIGEDSGEGLEQGLKSGIGEAGDVGVREIEKLFKRLQQEAKAGSAVLQAIMAGAMSGVIKLPGAPRGAGGSIGPMIRRQRAQVQVERQAQTGGTAALIAGMMSGVIPMPGAPRGAGGSIGPMIRQQRAQVQAERQAQTGSTAALMLGMMSGVIPMPGTPRGAGGSISGLIEQERAKARERNQPQRVAGIIAALASARGNLSPAAGVNQRLAGGGVVNPGVLSSGYIGRSAISPGFVNYPPDMPAAYGSGFMGAGAGRYPMSGQSIGAGGGSFVPIDAGRSVGRLEQSLVGLTQKVKDAASAVRSELMPTFGDMRRGIIDVNRSVATSFSAQGGYMGGRYMSRYGNIARTTGFPTSGMATASAEGIIPGTSGGSMGRFPSAGMAYPSSARGSMGMFPSAGMTGPSSPLGVVSAQSTMFRHVGGTLFGAGGGGGFGRFGGGFGGMGGFGGGPGGGSSAGVPGSHELGQAGRSMQQSLQGAMSYMQTARVPLSGAIRELGGEFGTAVKQVLLFGTAYKGLAFLTSLPGQAFEAAKGMQTFQNQLQAVTSESGTFEQSFQFIDNLATRFNVPLESARQGFIKMYASMQPAGFNQGEIEGLFTGVSQAAAAFGMSSDQVERVTNAFSQMASKGQIMSEELKGQLGDVLPGALSIFAEAAGMEIPEFSQAMEDGAFKGKAMQEVLNNVATVFTNKFGPAAQNASKTLQGAVNAINNNLLKMYESFGPIVDQMAAVFGPQITKLIQDITSVMKVFTGTFSQAGDGFDTLSPRAQALYTTIQQLIPTFQQAGRALVELGQFFVQLVPVAVQLGNVLLQLASSNVGKAFIVLSVSVGILQTAFIGLARVGVVPAIAAIYRFIGTQLASVLIGWHRQLITLTRSMIGFTAAARASRVALIALRTALTGLVVGGILLGLEAIGAAIAGVGNKANQSASAVRQLKMDLDQMAGAGDTIAIAAELEKAKATEKAALARLTKAQQVADATMGAGGFVDPQATLAVRSELDNAQRAYNTAQESRNAAQKSLQNAEKIRQQQQAQPKPLAPITPSPEGEDSKTKKERESQVPQLKLRLELAKKLFEIDKQIADAKLRDNTILVSELELKRKLVELDYEARQVLLEVIPDDEKRLRIMELQFQRQQAILDSQLKLQLDLNNEHIKTQEALTGIISAQQEETSYVQKYYDLVLNGVNPAIAKTRVEIAKRFAQESKSLDLQITQLEVGIATAETTVNLLQLKRDLTATEKEQLDNATKNLQVLREHLQLRQGMKADLPEVMAKTEEQALAAEAPKPFGVIVSEGYQSAKSDLEELTNSANMVVTAANSIGDAFGKAFTDIATGAQTWQEGLGNAFQSVASMFADMVAQMLAKWAAMQIISMFLPGASGPGAASPMASAARGTPGAIAPNGAAYFGPAFANGGIAHGGFRAFASGGIVTGPTLGLVGEGRFNEAVVPLPDGKKIPVELGGGAGNNISTNIVVNMNNGQASSQTSGGGGQALGRELEGAVRNVILKESRPGGLIYSGR